MPNFAAPYSFAPVTNVGQSSSIVLPCGDNVAIGDELFVFLWVLTPSTFTYSVSDNYANTWNLVASKVATSGFGTIGIYAFHTTVTATGAGFQATGTVTGGTRYIGITGLGSTPSSPAIADGLSTGSGSGTIADSGTFTTTGVNDLVVFFAANSTNANSWTLDSALNLAQSYPGVNNRGNAMILGYSTSNTAGSQHFSAIATLSGTWATIAFGYANQFTETISASPTSVATGNTLPVAVSLTGSHVSPAWDGSTVFTISGVAGVAIDHWTIDSTSTATLYLTTGSTTGTLTISDGVASTNLTIALQPMQISAWVDKSGYLLLVGTASNALTNGAATYLAITAIAADPTATINGSPAVLGPRTWTNTSLNGAFVAYRLPQQVIASDVLTWSLAAGALTTSAGSNLALNTTVSNFAGQLEGPSGGFPGFQDAPTMLLGANWGSQPSVPYSNNNTHKNLLTIGGPWTAGPGCTIAGTDANGFPTTWTPGKYIQVKVAGSTWSNQVDSHSTPTRMGTYTAQYDDPTDDWTLALVGTATVCSSSAPTVTRSGSVVTVTWDVAYLPTTVAWNPQLFVRITSVAGAWGNSNLWVFPPGATIDRSDPWATSEEILSRCLSARGRTFAIKRDVDISQGYGGIGNFRDAADLISATEATWNGQTTYTTQALGGAFVRFINTDPAKGPAPDGDGTYGWVSTRVYGDQDIFVGGTDSFGNYLPLAASDNGQFMYPPQAGGSGWSVQELRWPSPHGLKFGYAYFIKGTTTITLTNGVTLTPVNNQCAAWITGPNTACVAQFSGGNPPVSSNAQTVAGTAEIATDWYLQYQVPFSPGCAPYEYGARLCNQLGGSRVIDWVNLPFAANAGCIREIVRRRASKAAHGATWWLEVANEWWNYQPGKSAFTIGWLMAALPPGTSVFNGHLTTNGSAVPNLIPGCYPLIAAAAMDTAVAELQTLGRTDITVKRVLGGRYTSPTTTQQMLQSVQTYGLEFDYIGFAPYMNLPNNSTIVTAMTSGQGEWPVAAINSFARHWFAYNTLNTPYWGQHKAYIDQYAPGMQIVCYEGFPQRVIAYTNNALQHDIMAHPSYYDLIWCYLLAIQRGTPTVADSAPASLNIYQLFTNPGNFTSLNWMGTCGNTQPPGYGLSNQYATSQGGAPADGLPHYSPSFSGGVQTFAGNESPSFQALLDWIDITSPALTFGPIDIDPDAGTLLIESDPFPLVEVDPDAGSLIIV